MLHFDAIDQGVPIRFKFEFVGDLTKTFLEAATLDTVSKSVTREISRCTQGTVNLLRLTCCLFGAVCGSQTLVQFNRSLCLLCSSFVRNTTKLLT